MGPCSAVERNRTSIPSLPRTCPVIGRRRRRWTGGESNPGFRNAIAASSLWTTSPWCLGVESNHDLLLFRQALVPHELPRHSASDENRTRPFCLDRAAFPPGNLGGNWSGGGGSNSSRWGHNPVLYRLSYLLVRPEGIEPPSAGNRPAALPLCERRLVGAAGIEPASSCTRNRCLTNRLRSGGQRGRD
jgi:hypothetical protein